MNWSVIEMMREHDRSFRVSCLIRLCGSKLICCRSALFRLTDYFSFC